jgi:YfiH family protein
MMVDRIKQGEVMAMPDSTIGGMCTERATSPDVHVLRSALLDGHGFRHAFATRSGGVSGAPYDTLNLGFHLGDDEEAVRENRLRFTRALELSIDRLFELRQVHGADVREVSELDRPEVLAHAQGDALIARVEGIGVAARTADCAPVLIAHPSSGHVAAVHVGWRGAVANVVTQAIRALAHDPAELVVAIGPHIRVGAFEIGEEVARAMERAANGGAAVERRAGRLHGDLSALIRLQLLGCGVPRDAVDDVGGCTHAEVAQFFSHRRDRGTTGRHLSVIVAGAPR